MVTILLVEDNELNRDMLTRRLERAGHSVLIATNGLEALEAARESRPDLILMDMSLPELDGWAATRALKADERTQAIPVIALTAHAMSGDREKALRSGCDGYETKPVDFERLRAAIDELARSEGPE